ncbi:hypothetical protein OVA03_10490 [Asticcacaulis sp. SL142]|uniref:hypothetical protein n=1 Tax=Asticcacaulis sp. SL142 TaxID=2995155 RepID=UPI00226CA210|nr:hypothetical protein [Asticcacaulis sp. SL142]WAC47136.1 hypothetical protein OVA03_10490 [Asticcacaulis sp. SL142]
MRITALAIWAAMAVFSSPVAAQAVPVIHQQVYEGTLGKHPIVLEILSTRTDAGQDVSAARYFYRQHRAHIQLGVERRGVRLILREYDPACYLQSDQCPAKASFTLTPRPDGLSGQWIAAGRLSGLPVMLKSVGDRKVSAVMPVQEAAELYYALDDLSDYEVSDNPYLWRQLAATTTYGPEVRTGAVGYVMATDKGTGIHYPRLSRHPSLDILTRVNRLLDRERYRMTQYGLDCRAQSEEAGGGTLGGWEDYDSEVSFITETVMAIREGGSTYCGGAYPNNSFRYALYDLRRGEVLDINRLLKLDGPEYGHLLAKLQPGSAYDLKQQAPEDCLGEGFDHDYSLSFNDKGLVFSLTDLPHVIGACMGDYYVVPYADLKGLWRPEAVLYFPRRIS